MVFNLLMAQSIKEEIFQNKNQNCLKLIDKYNDLAREALSKGDKTMSKLFSTRGSFFKN